MRKVYLLVILFTIIFQSCNDDNCGECFTPPQSFSFEIVDKTSGENLFTNGTFNSNEITITDNLNNDEPIDFSFISENDINIIHISSIGWETETVNLEIHIANNHIFDFYIDAERKIDDCCSYTDYNEIIILNSEFELNTETGTYVIFTE
ncbi:hypothetical protein [Maribacter dokdonensis]|uniref:hypothetical protein n=1 Tax=Maribacter dokdonensis TaxID=320912 RepID=UPI00329A02C2